MGRVLVAGTGTGTGKTTVCLALAAALTRRGLRVAPFKVGPDFIDAALLGAVAGRPARALDPWMTSPDWVRASLARHEPPGGLALIEGMMGLFDGAGGPDDRGSAAEVARLTGTPVLLVVDARGVARSAGALALGFARFDPGLSLAGIIFNGVGGPAHRETLEAGVAPVGLPILGALPWDGALAIPERHLGLLTPEARALPADQVARLAAAAEAHLDLDRIVSIAAAAPPLPVPAEQETPPAGPPVRIALARDAAFSFYYQDNLDLLEASGAVLVAFSPLNDARLPAGLGGLYLGGGYPESEAAGLAGNASMREEVRRAVGAGLPVLAECGGFMYLCRAIEDDAGRRHPMVGIFDAVVRFPGPGTLAYCSVDLVHQSPLGPPGASLRGHEFHASSVLAPPPVRARAYRVRRLPAGGPESEGYLAQSALGSYLHLHWGSCPDVAGHFVATCRAHAQGRGVALPAGAGGSP
ncbi:MAG: cobyrinate a,c-diamide synthase [candidate division NC10 bacterium]|nr:cobyrinate a,c-diamide synthase [candidate division NC10 bacterium]